MRSILPRLAVYLTGETRYIPEIKWSSQSWTHNVFRVWELLFGRRFGIRAEMSSVTYDDEYGEKKVAYACHSWESVFALGESYIRATLKSLKPAPFRIWIPVLQTPQGIPVFASPYLFAVAFDATTRRGASGTTSSPMSWNHTCTGSDLVIHLGAASSSTLSTPTYNAVGSTLVGSQRSFGGFVMGLYYLLAPSTGSHSVSWTFTGNANGAAVSWSGVSQSGQPDAANGNATTSANASVTVTTVADKCWVVGFVGCASTSGVSAGLTSRQGLTFNTTRTANMQDTNGPKTPAGAQVCNWTNSSQAWGCQAASFAPLTAVPNKIYFVKQAPNRASTY